MTQFLPPNLLELFAARHPLPFIPPPDCAKIKKNLHKYSGVSQYLSLFEDPKDTPAPTRGEKRDEKVERKKNEKAQRAQEEVELKVAEWDPHSDPHADTDAFKTLFCARVNFETTDSKLRRELEVYGPIRKINLVQNSKKNQPRGYAFVEYEHERDMHAAYKHADGKKIDGRRILVDVERGRTVKSWRPRRLGGGLGGTRRGGSDMNIRHSGRVDNMEAGGGDRSRDRDRDERKRDRSDRGDRGDRGDRDRDRHRDRDRDRDRGDRDRRRDRERDRGDRGDRGDRDRSERRERRDRGDRDRGRDRDRDRDRSRGRDRDEDSRERTRDIKREEGDGSGGVESYDPQSANGDDDKRIKEEEYNGDDPMLQYLKREPSEEGEAN